MLIKWLNSQSGKLSFSIAISKKKTTLDFNPITSREKYFQKNLLLMKIRRKTLNQYKGDEKRFRQDEKRDKS